MTETAARVSIVLGLAGKQIEQLPVSGSAEPITFSQDEGRLIIDSAEGGTALFVDRENHVTTVQKDPGQHGQETSSSAKPPVSRSQLRPQGGNRTPGKLPAPQIPFKLPSFIPYDLSNLPANSGNTSSGNTSSAVSRNGKSGTSRNG